MSSAIPESRLDATAENATIKAAHVEKIKAAFRTADRMQKRSDRLRAGENLWNILEACEQRGLRKAKIAQEAGFGGDGDSTKRLYDYAINPSHADAKKAKLAEKAVQKIEKYLRIVRVAGVLTHKNEDHYIAQFAQGISIADLSASSADRSAPSNEDHQNIFADLAELIREISAGIARKYDLARVFRDIDDYGIGRVGPGGSMATSEDKWHYVWENFVDGMKIKNVDDAPDKSEISYQACFGRWILPYPNVRIGFGLLRDNDNYFVQFRSESFHDLQPPATPNGWVIAEVRLAIAPIGDEARPTPVFITKLWTHIWLSNEYRNRIGARLPGHDIPFWLAIPRPVNEQDDEFHFDLLEDTLFPSWKPDLHGALCDFLQGNEPGLAFGLDRFVHRYGRDSASSVRIDIVSEESCRRILGLGTEWIEMLGCGIPTEGYRVAGIYHPVRYRNGILQDGFRKAVAAADAGEPACTAREFDSSRWHVLRSEEDTLARLVEASLFGSIIENRLDTVLEHVCRTDVQEVNALLGPIKQAAKIRREEILSHWKLNDSTRDSPL